MQKTLPAAAIHAGLNAEAVATAEDAAKADGTPVIDFAGTICDMLAAAPANTIGPRDGPGGVDIVPGEDEHDKRSRGITAALLARTPSVRGKIEAAAEKYPNNPAFQNLDFDGGEFRSLSLVEHLKADLEMMKPGSSRGVSNRTLLPTFSAAAGFAVGFC